jgi:hypothetical protein
VSNETDITEKKILAKSEVDNLYLTKQNIIKTIDNQWLLVTAQDSIKGAVSQKSGEIRVRGYSLGAN